MGGWMDRWMRWVDGCLYACMDGWIDEVGGCMNGWMGGVGRWMDGTFNSTYILLSFFT